MTANETPLTVAIVGGGITGLSLALGLLRRNIDFKIYERASSFGEIGAGIGFTPNAENAMKLLDPRIHAAFRTTATQNNEDFFNYVDGYNWNPARPDHEEPILRMYLGERGFEGCKRSDFLDEMVKHIPKELVEFDCDVVGITEGISGAKMQIKFRDGHVAEADVVVGCDGLRSKTRRILLSDSHPAARPGYSHKYAIRGLISMAKAREALGEWRTSTRLMHLGPDAHALTFPIARGALLNVVAFVTDPEEWPAADGKLTLPASKSEATRGFSKLNPIVKTIMDLLPEQLDKWAVFDTYDNRVPTYVSGRLVLAGDSAHAAAPHHGAGAGCGIEDCLALAVLLEAVAADPSVAQIANLTTALQVYNEVRYERSQFLVDTSRLIGEIYQFQGAESGSNPKKIADEIYTRSHRIWDYSVADMVDEALESYRLKCDPVIPAASPGSEKTLVRGQPFLSGLGELGPTEKALSSTDVSTNVPIQDEFLDGFQLAALIACFTLVMFLMMLDMSILSTAIPYITDDFESLLDVGWYGATYGLVCASLQPLTGKMYTRLDPKVLFLGFFIVFAMGSAICGAAQSSIMLIIGRTIAGVGGAGLMNGAFTIINSCVEPRRRPSMIGIMMAFGNLGSAMGPLIGGGITQYASWRWCFYINLPAGGVMAPILLWLTIPDNIAKPHWKTVLTRPFSEFDLVGFGLFTPASIMLFLALEFAGGGNAWGSSEVIGLLCGSVGLLTVWAVWNYRKGEAAMLPFSIVRAQVVWASCLTIFSLFGSAFVVAYYLPLYFQGVRGDTPFTSGVDLLPTALTQVVFTLFSARLVEVIGYYLPFVLVGGALNSIGSGLLTTVTPTTTLSKLTGYQILSGTGRGLALALPMIAVQHTVPLPRIPIAMSTLVFFQNLGGALLTVVGQSIFTSSFRSALVSDVPGVDADTIVTAGTTVMRRIVPSAELPAVLQAFSHGVSRTMYAAVTTAVAGCAVSWLMGWRDVRPKREVVVGNGEVGDAEAAVAAT